MRLLLDTHAAIWWPHDDPRLSERAADLLEDAGNDVLLSAAVIWEIEIKRQTGKLRVNDDIEDFLATGGAVPLPISLDHARAAGRLPPHHPDPFDRVLIAQAMAENATLVSRDDALRPYGVPLLW